MLELRERRRVAVPIQISSPQGEATEVLEEQNQLALVSMKSSDFMDVSSAHFEEDKVFVEDWVSDTYSEDADLPLAGKPLAFSVPLAMEEQEVVGVESFVGVDSSVRQEPYSEWFQSRFNNFDSFLGMSLEDLENQVTEFLLTVEAELKHRAALNKKAHGSGVKGLREFKGLFNSINYGSTSARRSGNSRDRALFVSQ